MRDDLRVRVSLPIGRAINDARVNDGIKVKTTVLPFLLDSALGESKGISENPLSEKIIYEATMKSLRRAAEAKLPPDVASLRSVEIDPDLLRELELPWPFGKGTLPPTELDL